MTAGHDKTRTGLPDAVARLLQQQAADRLAIDDAAFDEAARRRQMRSAKPGDIVASPFHWTDPAALPRRQPLYGNSYFRKNLIVTVAPGGVGKSSLAMAEALALVTGRPLLGKTVPARCSVWFIGLEDSLDEHQRRAHGIAQHYDIDPVDTEGRFFVDSGRDLPLVMAVAVKNKITILKPKFEQLEAEIRRRRIDVLYIDPWVSSHALPENDNTAIDALAKEWARLADRTNTCIHLVHHSRKQASDAEITADSSRGAKALTDAAREVRVVNRMSADEGTKFGVDNHRSLFRVYSDKLNLAPPADVSDWYQLHDVELPNGDRVGVVGSWSPPDAFDAVTPDHLLAVQRRVASGQYRADVRAKDWVGHVIGDVLGLDLGNDSAVQKVKLVLRGWLKTGALKEGTLTDPHRNKVKIVEVGRWADQ